MIFSTFTDGHKYNEQEYITVFIAYLSSAGPSTLIGLQQSNQ